MILTRLSNTAALVLYGRAGEKLRRQPTKSTVVKITEKRDKAEAAAKVMEDKSPTVKAAASVNRAKVTAAPVSRPLSTSITPAAFKLKTVPNAAAHVVAVPAAAAQTKKAASPAPTIQKRKAASPAKATATSAKKSPPKKKEKKDPFSYCNKRVAKFFQGNVFFGTISRYVDKAKYWAIDYDDGDEEEFDETEVQRHMKLYEEHKDSDPGRN
jgi:hypothetical protein